VSANIRRQNKLFRQYCAYSIITTFMFIVAKCSINLHKSESHEGTRSSLPQPRTLRGLALRYTNSGYTKCNTGRTTGGTKSSPEVICTNSLLPHHTKSLKLQRYEGRCNFATLSKGVRALSCTMRHWRHPRNVVVRSSITANGKTGPGFR